MVPPAPYRPKDFTLVKKDGVYHLFYIRRDVTQPLTSERDFGHAISTDLYSWTQLPAVLAVADSLWDNEHVWAPSIVLRDSIYYMFYTGVTADPGVHNHEQRMGVATSTDLMTWNRMDAPVLSCAAVPWTYCDPLSAVPGFRDPFVMPDPAQPGHYLMYYTATANLDSSSMAVGVAASDGDLTAWSDLKPLWATFKTYSGSAIIESPHVFEHDGLWYLFYSTNLSQPLYFLAGPDPLADPGGWPYAKNLGDMLGYTTYTWFASEYFQDGLHDYFCFVNSDRIEMYEMNWQAPAQFSLYQPDQFHVVDLRWDADTVVAGASASLEFQSVNWIGRSAAIEAVVLDSTGAETPAPLDSLGLPATIAMTSDTTRWSWSARRWPSTGGASTRLVVRLQDHTAATPRALTVLPDTSTAPPDTALVVTGLEWAVSNVKPGLPAALTIAATGWSGHSAELLAFTPDDAGGLVPVPLDSLGLPGAIPLTGDSTVYDWTARLWPSTGDTNQVMRLLLRDAHGSAETGFLRVGPDSIPPPVNTVNVLSMSWQPTLVQEGEVATMIIAASNADGRSITIEAFLADSVGGLTAAPLDSVGLPATFGLVGDITWVDWTARRWVGAAAPGDTMRLVIRLVGDTLGTGPLAVLPDSIPAPPDTAFQVTEISWKVSKVESGKIAPLCLIARNAAGRAMTISAFTVDSVGTLWPAPLDSLGLPAAITLVGDTTLFDWTARTWPDTAGTSASTRVVLHSIEFGLDTAPLDVMPDSVASSPGPSTSGGGNEGNPVAEDGIRLRRVNNSRAATAPEFLVELGAPTAARLDVFDVMGRRVRTLADRILPAGASVLRWDGRASDGRPARAGIYFARLSTGRGVRVTRALLLP